MQSLFVIVQLFMIDALHINEEFATNIRVIATAVPILISFFYLYARLSHRLFIIYLCAFIVLLFNMVLYPLSESYVKSEALRFIIPVIIPTGLCVAAVSDLRIFEKTIYMVSWTTLIVAVVYFMYYFMGRFAIDSYSMSFSYALLLPALSFYTYHNRFSKLMSLIPIIMIISIGSRGALVAVLIFILMKIILQKNKFLSLGITLFAIISFGFLLSYLETFFGILESFGIKSRTLYLLIEQDYTHDSGRNNIYTDVWNLILENPIFGSGLYADRIYLGYYTHNIILELLLNFGLFFGGIVIIYFVISQICTFNKLNYNNKLIYLKYAIVLVLPLMFSSSYLQNYNLGMFFGVIYLLRKSNITQYERIS